MRCCSHLVPNAVAAVLDGAEAVAAAAVAAWCGDGAPAVGVNIGAVVACSVGALEASAVAADLDVLEADHGNLLVANHVMASCHVAEVGRNCPKVEMHLDVSLHLHFGLPRRARGHLQNHRLCRSSGP